MVILGDGPLKGALIQQAKQLGISEHITFKGFVEEPLALMKSADLFVISSRWEGFCNVIVEALLCGLPIVATDCPSGPDEILDQGRFGRLVPVGDAPELALAMKELLNDRPDPQMQHQRALEFTAPKICDRYEALALSLIGGDA